jgi:4-hydroxybenzoate polyprenyltransferase/phosphoserine phosphatase
MSAHPTEAALAGRDRHATPLCVDLDGTLVRCDLLAEQVLELARRRPALLLRLPFWLSRGRARLKQEIASRVSIDPRNLPYNPELLELLERERRAGRRIVLVTAAHRSTARRIADHLELFDEVIATERDVNLKGRTKRDELVRRFGERGFDYAGNSAVDVPVWSAARTAIVVNCARRVASRVACPPERVLDRQRGMTGRLVSAIRVRQWVKNLLIFVPMLLAWRAGEPELLVQALLAFVSFSFGASAIYVLNDLLDLGPDRTHPTKCRRPFASGDLPLWAGVLVAPALAAASLAIGAFLPPHYLPVLLLYFLLTSAYSMALKRVVLIDVLLLAALYSLRITAGSTATGVAVSEWLLAFSLFIFLSLGGVKRYVELHRNQRETKAGVERLVPGRGYVPSDLAIILQMGLSSGYMAVLVLALYVSSETVTVLYRQPSILWFVCPVLLYWISRVWMLAHRGRLREDPVMFAVRDRVTWVVAAVASAIALAARGVPFS